LISKSSLFVNNKYRYLSVSESRKESILENVERETGSLKGTPLIGKHLYMSRFKDCVVSPGSPVCSSSNYGSIIGGLCFGPPGRTV
jgi:hypothetical protein